MMHLQRAYFNEIQILRTQDMPLSLCGYKKAMGMNHHKMTSFDLPRMFTKVVLNYN